MSLEKLSYLEKQHMLIGLSLFSFIRAVSGRKLIRSGVEDAELLICSELVAGGYTQIYLLS